ncbi:MULTISPECIES: hypothetical protein [unclassified Streptomyces]|uniref:hypothetical protein n=1 Tax=unclassified Streptomyces TaxID=2593676 RepID=UPI0006FB0727|nr:MULTISPECIES: hypothetical protein [unclassified Streptomyces]KQX59136.1 hypothetical protein ASD33_02235 [Streptomyces sp. Root1304]KRB00397.1 hypothetical protein ASE09_02235 [Streptomyces sp. Root66D1]
MATPERAEPARDHVSMTDLLASCAAARTLSTPPRRTPERCDEEPPAESPAEPVVRPVVRGEAA